jgi:hypothetical protein
MRRLAVLIGLLLPLAAGCTTATLTIGGDPSGSGEPRCSAAHTQRRDQSRSGLLLMAQSVRSATVLPCLHALPVGWTFAGLDVTNKRARFWLTSDRDGVKAVSVSVSKSCDTHHAVESASGRSGLRRYDRVQAVSSGYRADRYFLFPGGCITYHFALQGHTGSEPATAVSSALDFVSRAALARSVADYSDGRLALDPTPATSGPR